MMADPDTLRTELPAKMQAAPPPFEDDDDALTDSVLAPNKTCETCETCNVSNADFLKAVHHATPEGARFGVVTFPGNPASAPSAAWKATPASMDLPDLANNYFTIACYYNDEAGGFRRTKKTFAALAAVMLDDIGTKIDGERVALAPSWRLETSPGNFQLGFILAPPVEAPAEADRFMKAVIDAELCDPGAGGPTARLVRLPTGINGKTNPPFSCRLTEWAPERRYTLGALVAGLGLELPEAGRPKAQRHPANPRPAVSDDVYLAAPDHNPVITALQAKGLYKQPLGSGRHDLTCPWVSEHTAALDNGAAYFEPDDGFPLGGFKCLHSHGDRLHIRDLLGFLKVAPNHAKMKPTLRAIAGDLHRVVDRGEQLLAGTGLYYQAGNMISVVSTDPATEETYIQPVSAPAVVRALSRVALWERYDGRAEDFVTCDPPARHCAVLYDASDYPHLPVLRGIARQPHLRDDGSLVATAGYDRLTGRFGVFNARQFAIPARPSRADAQRALGVLLELIDEVAFADPAIDQAAALSAMLAAAVRPSLPTCPGYLTKAHQIGSGKSFLNRIISTLATAQNVPGVAFPGDGDEMRKTLIAMLMKSPAVINFDDLNGDIVPSESLKTCLTEEFIGGRLLGLSKDITCSTRSLFLFSGNNVEPLRDMARRLVSIHLDPATEKPTERQFKRPHAEADARRHRARYVSAALTIVRAWLAAGAPLASVKPVASYGRWSDWCRQPLLWLGLADPATRLFEQLTRDPDHELLGRMLRGWRSAHGHQAMLVREVLAAHPEEDFREALRDVAEDKTGEINRNRLGWWLRKHEGRVVAGLRFERGVSSRGGVAWSAVQVLQVLQVSASAPTESVTARCTSPAAGTGHNEEEF
ncbi:MAG: hypothetical protein KAX51_07220 [Chromatiaceae bacterium]|nr:hypothetical protein [Chromatiaceae bacterium]MBP8289577.1 hypothetical protein [Chromatiaceae bacterium]